MVCPAAADAIDTNSDSHTQTDPDELRTRPPVPLTPIQSTCSRQRPCNTLSRPLQGMEVGGRASPRPAMGNADCHFLRRAMEFGCPGPDDAGLRLRYGLRQTTIMTMN